MLFSTPNPSPVPLPDRLALRTLVADGNAMGLRQRGEAGSAAVGRGHVSGGLEGDTWEEQPRAGTRFLFIPKERQ